MSGDNDYSWVWWIVIGFLILSALSSNNDSSSDYNDEDYYCVWYDADPTQWTDPQCE